MKDEKKMNKAEEAKEEKTAEKQKDGKPVCGKAKAVSDADMCAALTEENENLIAENEELKKKSDELQKKLDEESDKYLRLAAEYENYRKRSTKERESTYADAYADALKEILPIIDNLERAQAAGGSDKVEEGLRLIMSQASDTLKNLGVEAFAVPGDIFDPQIHNAVMHIEDEEHKEGEIVEVFQKGYRKGDRIIRYGMVKTAN